MKNKGILSVVLLVILIGMGAAAYSLSVQSGRNEAARIYLQAAEQERLRAEAEAEEEKARSAVLLEREKWAGEAALKEAIQDGRIDEMYARGFLDLIEFQGQVTLESLHYARTGETMMETKHKQSMQWMTWGIVGCFVFIGVLLALASMETWIPMAGALLVNLLGYLSSRIPEEDELR